MSPIAPGLGDFIRGICYLFERLEGTGIELRVDVSKTAFAPLIDFDPDFLYIGDERKVATAEEFVMSDFLSNPKALYKEIDKFSISQEENYYLCTSLGKWNRTSLPKNTREFVKKFYCFTEKVIQPCKDITCYNYEVLSIRTGDKFKNTIKENINQYGVSENLKKQLLEIIENKIIPSSNFPILVTSDSYELKCELVNRYNFMMFPHASSHGAYGNALPVMIDLNLIKCSKYNYHVNLWQPWWSGFSHYTSLIFQIPTTNFRAPLFVKEEITKLGKFRISEPPIKKIRWVKERFSSKWERLIKQNKR